MLCYYFWFFFILNFYLKPLNTPGSNNVKEHKADRKNGKGGYMWFSYASQILHEISADLTLTVSECSLLNLMFKNI